jgi:glycosyltransferase involved in cell wall biosynthesis
MWGWMRIAYVLTTLAVGGTEKQVLAIAGRMAARGHRVTLLVLKPHQVDDWATDLNVVHVDIHKSPTGILAGFRRGLRFLASFQPDVIHSHNFHGNMFARVLRLFYRRAKLISTIHNVYEGGRLRMLAYRMSDGLADRTTAVSVAVAERYIALHAVRKANCAVLSNGIDIAEFAPDAGRRYRTRTELAAGGDFVWLTVGRGTRAKDLKNLLQAMGNLCGDTGNAQLWIAGEASSGKGAEYEYVVMAMPGSAREKVRRLGLRRDIPALLDAADGFVLSSAWEGMPLALGEAMAMKKPVVATDVGGVRELVGDAGALVPARDSTALAGAMLDVMRRSVEERAAMGCAAWERISAHFTLDAKADEWETLYRSVIG